jgi:hypothetical protein
MCGPSSGLKALNTTVAGMLNTAKTEAASVFGAASTVFNNLLSSVQQIVKGGPSQQGYSADELNAMNAAVVQGGATMARNLSEAAGTSAAAVGGGNTATPGAIESAELGAKTAAAAETAGAENQVVQENYAQGNKNYEQAVGQEMNLPNVFNPATESENAATSTAGAALKTQEAVEAGNNWWQPIVTSAIGGVSGMATGGLMKSFGVGQTPAAPAANAAPTIDPGSAVAIAQGN